MNLDKEFPPQMATAKKILELVIAWRMIWVHYQTRTFAKISFEIRYYRKCMDCGSSLSGSRMTRRLRVTWWV